MIHLDFRPSARSVTQIAKIERICGRTERLLQNASDQLFESCLAETARSALALEASPSSLSEAPNTEEPAAAGISADRDFLSTIAALRLRCSALTADSLARIEYCMSADSLTLDSAAVNLRERLRVKPGDFAARLQHDRAPEMVFPTVAPFLIEKRLTELLDWLDREIAAGLIHPLTVIGTFHLLFLQIHPFARGNHRLSLVLLFHLLRNFDYRFVEASSFTPFFASKPRLYFASLRQAEKTALASWSSLNAWLEFFFEALIGAASTLAENYEFRSQRARLTPTQERILELAALHGSISRERVVAETGINLSTVKYNLAALAEMGHLRKEGGGRTTSYRLI